MPGIKSLQAREYYAHPRNTFWKIINTLFKIDIEASYPSRYSALLKSNIALWDTLQSCHREGSLDAKIDRGSEVANDFLDLLDKAPKISHIFFNGAKSESAFNKLVAKELLEKYPSLQLIRLPSTSPAHASLSFEGKLNSWSVVKQVLE
jgi:hypoxanthine-DNA glycosylase